MVIMVKNAPQHKMKRPADQAFSFSILNPASSMHLRVSKVMM